MIKSKKMLVVIILSVIVVIGLLYFIVLKKQVQSINLNKQYMAIYEGASFKLEATIIPDDIKVDGLIWKSNQPQIASVSNDGIVNALSSGYAKIVVSTKDGKVSNSCVINVLKKIVEDIEFEESQVNLKVGEEKELKLIVTPEDLSSEKVTWTSKDSSIVTIDENGKISAIKEGITEIEASILEKEATSVVIVGTKPESIKFENSDVSIEIGKEQELKVNVTPIDSPSEKIIWESSDTNVLEVDENGKILAKILGEATVTATSEYTKLKDTCKVTITKKKYEIKYQELDKTVIKYEDEEIGEIPKITKKGYIFLGWFTDAKNGTKVTEKTIVTSNMTLYPHWEIEETYTTGPGSGYYSKTVTYMGRTFKDYKQNRMPGGIPAGGCGPVSLLDVLSGYGNTDINDIIKITGLSTSFTYINNAARFFGLQHSKIYAYKSSNSNDAIVRSYTDIAINALKKGHQLIVLVSRTNMCAVCNGLPYDAFSWGNHFIAIVGLKKDGETAIILNPMEGRMEEGRMEDIIKYFLPGGPQSGFVEYWK